jgi:hypothetical protein
MILHQDGLIMLLYEPRTDILSVRWPDINHTTVPVLKYSFIKLMDAINHYHITKLLIDSRDTAGDVEDEDYKLLVTQLSQDLAATSLNKIARIVSGDEKREARTQAYTSEIKAKINFKLKSKEFNDEEEAIAWLISKEA